MSEKVKCEKNIVLKKDELVSKIADRTGNTKVCVSQVVDEYPKVVIETLLANLPKKNEISAVTLPGFGTMAVKLKPAETRTNNFTGEKVNVPAHYVPTFKPTKSIRVELNASAFEDKKKASATKAAASAVKGKKSA